MGPPKQCHHGKSFEEECLECDIEWHKETIAGFTEIVERAKTKLAKAEVKLKEQQNGKPTPEN